VAALGAGAEYEKKACRPVFAEKGLGKASVMEAQK
jgi:hypothetical protein